MEGWHFYRKLSVLGFAFNDDANKADSFWGSPWNAFFRFTARINDAVKDVETAMKKAGQQKRNLDTVTSEELKKRAAEVIAKMEDKEGKSKNHHDCLTCILVYSVLGSGSQESSS